MGAYDVSTEGDGFDALRASVAQLEALSSAESVHLVDLGKAFQALAQAMVTIANDAGRPSLRFEAVALALDLRTPKSALKAFLGR